MINGQHIAECAGRSRGSVTRRGSPASAAVPLIRRGWPVATTWPNTPTPRCSLLPTTPGGRSVPAAISSWSSVPSTINAIDPLSASKPWTIWVRMSCRTRKGSAPWAAVWPNSYNARIQARSAVLPLTSGTMGAFMDKAEARRCRHCGFVSSTSGHAAAARKNEPACGCFSLFEQHTAVIGPAYARDPRCFQLQSIEFCLLLRDDATLPADLIRELMVFDKQRAIGEELHDCRLQLVVGPRLSHELENAGVVDSPRDSFDIGVGGGDNL